MIPETIPQNYSQKYLYKTIVPKRLYFKSVAQSGSIFQCRRKLLHKVTQRYSPKLWFFKAVVQSCSSKLLLLPKAAPQSSLTKLFPKAVPQIIIGIESCSEQLFPKAAILAPKVISESDFPKLLPKISPKNYFSKQLFVNVAAKQQSYSPIIILQNCYRKPIPKMLPKIPKLVPEAASKLVLPKIMPKVVLQNYCPKAAILQTYSPKRSPKPPCKAASKSYVPKLSKIILRNCLYNCPRKLLPKAILLQSN